MRCGSLFLGAGRLRREHEPSNQHGFDTTRWESFLADYGLYFNGYKHDREYGRITGSRGSGWRRDTAVHRAPSPHTMNSQYEYIFERQIQHAQSSSMRHSTRMRNGLAACFFRRVVSRRASQVGSSKTPRWRQSMSKMVLKPTQASSLGRALTNHSASAALMGVFTRL